MVLVSFFGSVIKHVTLERAFHTPRNYREPYVDARFSKSCDRIPGSGQRFSADSIQSTSTVAASPGPSNIPRNLNVKTNSTV